MFENLLESKQKNQRTLGQTVLSLLVHGLIIVGAVKATQGVAETIKNRPVDTTMVFLKPPEPPKPPPEQPPPDVVVAANPPPKGFQTVVAPTDIPKDIPPIDLNEKPFDPKDFTGKGVAGGIAKGVVGGTPQPVNSDQPYFEFQVEKQVAPYPGNTAPRYPDMLRSANVEGEVLAQFVVDTTGRAEMNTFKVIKSTHDLFTNAVKASLPNMKFYPAEVGGKHVKQLVQMPFQFNLTKGE